MPIEPFLELPELAKRKITSHLSAVDLMRLYASSKALQADPALKTLTLEKIREESFIAVGPTQLFWCCAGRVFACGINENGNLGLGDTIDRSTLTEIILPYSPSEGVAQLISKGWNTFILTKTGRVFACGVNYDGRLGVGDTIQRLKFTEVRLPLDPCEKVQQIAADDATLFLTNRGRVFVCGENRVGALGLGQELKTVTMPTELHVSLGAGDKVKYIATYARSNVCLSEQGRVYVFGHNRSGKFGQGNLEDCFIPTELLVPLSGSDKVQSVILEFAHLFLLTHYGRAFACGNNENGKLGLGHMNHQLYPAEIHLPIHDAQVSNPIVNIVTTISNTFFQTKLGHIFACGHNSHFNLGCVPNAIAANHRSKANTIPTLVISQLEKEYIQRIVTSRKYNFFLTNKNRLLVAGYFNSDEEEKSAALYENPIFTKIFKENEEIRQFFATDDNIFFLTNNFKLIVWGDNPYGQLGLPDKKISVPTAISLPMPPLTFK